MGRKDKRKNKKNNEQEDMYDPELRKSLRKASKTKRKKDKRYLSDMLRGNIDPEDYYDYNDIN